MITLHKIARLHPNSEHDLSVGDLSIFKESDFYCKSNQISKLPKTHEFDERVIEAYEYLYELFSLKFGEKAKPRFSSTLRLKGDPNYRTAAGWLSYHSRARAADGNWNQHGQDVEDFIVCVIGYDIENRGFIYKKLRSIGIGGIGTYYREREGTFLHLDTREEFVHFRRVKRYKIFRAREWHEEMIELLNLQSNSNLNIKLTNYERSHEAPPSSLIFTTRLVVDFIGIHNNVVDEDSQLLLFEYQYKFIVISGFSLAILFMMLLHKYDY